jgi:anti-sigma B factor antagonist
MSDDGPLHRDVLHVETRHEDAAPVIIVVGELDISGTDQFWAHVSEAIEARPVSLAIDALGLTFVDSSGPAAMVRAREVATEAGVELRATDPSPPLRRIVEICGLEDLLLDG